MDNPSGNQRNPSNDPTGGSITQEQADSMTAVELADALERALESVTEDTYDEALIGAYLDALDRKAPIPDMPNVEAAFSDFQTRRRRIAEGLDEPVTVSKRPVRYGKLIRLGLAAALAVMAILGTMAVAQAAGWNVFEAMARWTDDIFSFGEITSEGAKDIPNAAPDGETDVLHYAHEDGKAEFDTLQEALDAYGITEVSEPEWIPDRFTLKKARSLCFPDGTPWDISAEYINGTVALVIDILNYEDEPSMQVEKTDAPVETFTVNDITVYLLENINNNTAAWVTEHYECYIGGAVEKSELRQMVLSIYANA